MSLPPAGAHVGRAFLVVEREVHQVRPSADSVVCACDVAVAVDLEHGTSASREIVLKGAEVAVYWGGTNPITAELITACSGEVYEPLPGSTLA